MTSALETFGGQMADGVRATFNFGATDTVALKQDVVPMYGSVKNLSAGNDLRNDYTLDM